MPLSVTVSKPHGVTAASGAARREQSTSQAREGSQHHASWGGGHLAKSFGKDFAGPGLWRYCQTTLTFQGSHMFHAGTQGAWKPGPLTAD